MTKEQERKRRYEEKNPERHKARKSRATSEGEKMDRKLTTPADPHPCARRRCPNVISSGKYCSRRCSVLAWQEKKRDRTKKVNAEFKAEMLAKPTQPVLLSVTLPAPDRILFCPACGVDKEHRPDVGMYRCRSCSRLRMTPEQSRRESREKYPAYRVETEQTG